MKTLLLLFALSRAQAAAPQVEYAFDSTAFADEWTKKGRETAARSPWLKEYKVLVLADANVDPVMPGLVAKAFRAQIASLGSKRLTLGKTQTPPKALSDCIEAGVIKTPCVTAAFAQLREDPKYAGTILYYLTNAAIDRLPEDLGGGASVGPPAGQASYYDGWMMQSFYYHELHKKQDPSLRSVGGSEFVRHSIAHTARHELGHLLGLPHHDQLKNPGFPEVQLCTACTHMNAGGHAKHPHPECLMFCGSGDDEWFHFKTFHEDFGLCLKCRAAAAAYLKGLEAP